ncbi:NAD-dependent epimerase/dehydratase family protein [Spiribacter roseus]|uniref:NAD-dependent epimerase/dehydratase family protein n=1 Tax=Spiribacter roseus TaxID=1855875 RepID=UPI001330043A|nr:NAD(P)-dependent oxidoreductase [Spiribacter roseus]
MKVLIFGITGNSGRHLAEFYLSIGSEVWGVGRRKDAAGLEQVNYISFDIQDRRDFARLPSEFDLVINLAGVQPSILNFSEATDLFTTLREYVDVNVRGIYNVLEYVAQADIGTYIYATTHRDYELYWKNQNFLDNDLPPAINYEGDHAMYAITKVMGRMMGDYMVPMSGTRCFNVRLPMMFLVPEWPYYLSDGVAHSMPFLKIIRDAIDGRPLEVWGDPNMQRDYVYIDNLVRVINGCYKSSLRKGTFSVGTGEAVSTEMFVKSIGNIFGSSQTIYKYRPEKRTYKSAVYNISEQKELLGYRPVLLDEMLQKMKVKLFDEGYLERWGWLR